MSRACGCATSRAGLGLVKRVIRMLARSTDFWLDTCWIVDSTPVPCGMSRPTVSRSDLAGWAGGARPAAPLKYAPQKTKKRQAQHGAEPLWWISSAVPAGWAAQVQARPDHARS